MHAEGFSHSISEAASAGKLDQVEIMIHAGHTVSLPVAYICTTDPVRYVLNLLPSSDTFIASAARVLSASRCMFSAVLEHTMHVWYFVTPVPCQQAQNI